MDRIRIQQDGNVVIPPEAFRRAGLRPGAEVVVRAQGPGRILVECAEVMDETSDLGFTGLYGSGLGGTEGMPHR